MTSYNKMTGKLELGQTLLPGNLEHCKSTSTSTFTFIRVGKTLKGITPTVHNGYNNHNNSF